MDNNFIGIYENAVPVEFCNQLIQFFENLHKSGFTCDRQSFEGQTKLQKEDDSLFMTNTMEMENYKICDDFLSCVWTNAYNKYSKEYAVLNDLDKHKIYEVKIQKTKIGGGYHVWHSEQGGRKTANRILAFIAYLNDVYEGGETEFYYYPKRVKAKTGTILLFPGGFTHAHRGNPPISNTKYIATGWIEF